MKTILSKTIAAIFSVLFLHSALNAQLTVDNTQTPAQLAQFISGPGVVISNPQVHSGTNGYGKYNALNSNLNISQGLLLTTGTIQNAIGPNNVGNKTTYFGNQYVPDNYPMLTNYTGRTIYEYCEFEFDIVPQGDTLSFDYVFASEEYEEWVGSQYNDVFGFFISGPGITPDPGAGVYHNIALIPNTSTAITINNVNQHSNTQYYVNNNNGPSVQYDGFTRGLKAISHVQPCQTYHLKLIVADASDKLWDSGVFIEKIKSNNILLLSHTAGGIPNMVEGCNNGTVSFTRQTVTNQPLLVTYFIGGTAINGTDYPLIGTSANVSSPKYITIPANQATASININPYADALNEGYEYMTIYLGNPYCSNAIMDSLRFYIQDSLYTTIAPTLDSLCVGNGVQLTTTGGGSAFSWSPSTGLSNASIPNPFATPPATTTYTLTTTASTCVMQKTSVLRVSNIALSFATNNISCNGSHDGSVTVTATGGFAPYTYSWTGPSSFTANTATITNLGPGTYTVTVTGRRSCARTGTVTITQPTTLTSSVSSPTLNGGYNVSCNGGNNGSATVVAAGGTSPYTYSWSTSPIQTTATATNLAAGTYTATVHDAHGCTSTSTITLTQPTAITASISSTTNVLCYGNNSGAATVSVSGGTPAYTYSWNTTPVQTGATASNLNAGTYIVTIHDGNNCVRSATATITQPATAMTATISAITHVLCRGGATGSATVSASGGTSPYTYSWNTTPVQTAATAINLAAGSYVVTVRDANNCTATVPVTITQPAVSLSASITSQTNVLCFGNNTGSATATATGGTAGYTYSWNTTPAQNVATATNLVAGNYTCTVHDANGCSTTTSVAITQPTATLTASVSSHTNVLCFGNNSGTATASATGGTSPYNYSWNTSPIQTTATASGLIAGNYTVTVTDAHSCQSTATVAITQPPTSVSAVLSSQTNVFCFGGNTGLAGVTASGGTSPYTYSWNSTPVQTTALATNLVAGNYTCTIHDANNCTATVTVSITQPSAALAASITASTNVLCRNNSTGAATVTATGGSGSYSYSWNSSPVQTTATASNLPAGSYTATVTDNNGCAIPVTASITITQPVAVLSATATSPQFNGYNISCNGGSNGSITVSTTGGTSPYSYAWTGPNAYSSTVQNPTGLVAGTYSLIVTDANGCTTSLTKTLSEPTLLDLTSVVTNATCPSFTNGAINITVTGGTAPYSYSWTGPSAFSATTEDISGLASGNYSVTVTDANGCTIPATITVVQPSSIAITHTVSIFPGGNNISCHGGANGSITVGVTGGTPFPGPTYLYAWTGPSGFTSSSSNISGLVAGTYQLIVTDANGCNSNLIVTLTEPAAIASTFTPSIFTGGYNISCNGASTGSINTSTTGGTIPYHYSWSGPSSFTSSSQNISSLVAGNYTLVVTDSNSCVGTNTIVLTQPLSLTANATAFVYAGGYNISCNGSSTGSITLTTSGGTAGYIYAWSGPSSFSSSQQNPNNLAAGAYQVTVTDTNACTATASITLTQPPVLSTSATSTTFAGGYNITCNGANDGSITLTTTGGTSSYTYVWTGPSGFSSSQQNPNSLGAGTYSVTVTDANGCTATTSITLTQPSVLSATTTSPTFIGGANISCYGTNTGAINLSVNGGTSAYSYQWSGPSSYSSTTQNPTALYAGTYSVLVTDANGCTSSSSITLTEPAILAATVSSPTFNGGYNISCNGSATGSINMNVTGGTSTYIYSWTGPSSFTSTNEDLSSLIAGTYSATITDQNGCSTTTSITLTQPAVFTGTISSTTFNGGYNISCNGNSNGSITLLPVGGTTSYSYIWSNGATSQNISNVPAGQYSVIATDANNCTFTQSITLTEPPVLTANASSPTVIGGYNLHCYGSADGSIDLGAGGGTSPYTYAWSGPSSFTSSSEDLSSLSAGTYSVLVTDNNGCTATTSITLTEPNLLTVALTSPTFNGGANISCNGNSDGAINSTVNGGTASYTYLWNGPSSYTASTPNISSLTAGTYSLTVTDVNGCVGNMTISITQPNALASVATPSSYAGGYNISCYGSSNGSISLSTTGGAAAYSYLWSGPNAFSATTQNISGLVAGIYTVVVTDANGCTTTVTQQISEPPSITDVITPSVFIGNNNISCNGANNGTIALTISGGANPYTQNWTGPNGFSSSSNSLSGLEAGTYYVTITDANTCTKLDSITLIQPAVLTTTLTSPIFVGGYNIKCHDDTTGVITNTILGGTGGFIYSWTGPNNFTSSEQNLLNVIAGTYNVNVTDTNGCTASSSITINQAPNPMSGTLTPFIYPGGTNISCTGASNGSVDLSFTGGIAGFTYWWRGPNNFSSSNQDVSGVEAGHYDVVVTDTNGCQLPLSIDLSEPANVLSDSNSVSLFPGNVNVSCNGSSNGSVNIFTTGGTPAYTYNWSGPNNYSSTNANINNLVAGTYYLSITDVNGCVALDTVTLAEPNPMVLNGVLSQYLGGNNISCAGATDGSIDLSVTGGTAGFTYSWTGPNAFSATTQDISSVSAGDYSVTVTDTNNCVAQFTDTLIEPLGIASIIIATPASCSSANGSADLTVAGGTLPYTYAWSNSATTQDLAAVVAGNYSVTIVDANGCSHLDSILINQTSALAMNAAVVNANCFGNADGSVNITILSGTSPYTYTWSNGATSEDISNLTSGYYAVNILDAAGCSVSDTFFIAQPNPLQLVLSSPLLVDNYNISSFNGADGSVNSSVVGGTSPYTYVWSNGATSSSIFNLTQGYYSLIVTDSMGCSISDTILLTAPIDLALPTGFSPNGDGLNDYFVIHGLDVLPDNSLTIFNRWGNEVYSTTDYQNNWYGTNKNGDVLPDGTYFIILEVTSKNVTLTGYVDIRR